MHYDPAISKDPSELLLRIRRNNQDIRPGGITSHNRGHDLHFNDRPIFQDQESRQLQHTDKIIKNGLAIGLDVHVINLGSTSVPVYKASRSAIENIELNEVYESDMNMISETLNIWHPILKSIHKYVVENLFYFTNNADVVGDVFENIKNYTMFSCSVMFEDATAGNVGPVSTPAMAGPINANIDPEKVKKTLLPMSYSEYKDSTAKIHAGIDPLTPNVLFKS